MDGIGPNLAGIVDDQVTDLLCYPQLNALARGWLVGIEMNQSGDYYPYARTPGPLSLAAALDATLRDSAVDCNPSAALAVQTGQWSIGAGTTVGTLGNRVVPPEELIGDTSSLLIYTVREGVRATAGARWAGSGLSVDGNLSGFRRDGLEWRVTRDSVVQAGDYSETSVSPSLRVTVPGEHLCWRGIASYTHWYGGWRYYEWPEYPRETTHELALGGGLTYGHGPSLLGAAGLQAAVSPVAHYWSWSFRLPVGLEWDSGPIAARLGADVSLSLRTVKWRGGAIETHFGNRVYFGLGLKPTEHLRLDFVPYMENVADLRGWRLAAALDF
jgi:hypothetical protein